MRIANRFAGDGAKAETLIGVEAAALQAANVEGKGFCLGVFEKEFAIVGAPQRFLEHRLHGCLVGIEEGEEVGVHGRLRGIGKRGSCKSPGGGRQARREIAYGSAS